MTHIMKINLAKIIWCLIIRHHNHTINNKNKKKSGKNLQKISKFLYNSPFYYETNDKTYKNKLKKNA